MRVVFMAIGVCGAAAIIGLLGLLSFTLHDIERVSADQLAASSSRHLKTDVSVAGMPISFKTGNGQIIGLRIGNPTGFSENSAIHAPEISVATNAAKSSKSLIYINKLAINRPTVLVEISDNAANLARLLQSVKASVETEDNPSGESIRYIVSEVLMEKGEVALMADVLGNENVTAPMPDSRITGLGQDENGISEAELIGKLTAFITKSAERATRRIDIAAIASARDLPKPDLDLKTLLAN